MEGQGRTVSSMIKRFTLRHCFERTANVYFAKAILLISWNTKAKIVGHALRFRTIKFLCTLASVVILRSCKRVFYVKRTENLNSQSGRTVSHFDGSMGEFLTKLNRIRSCFRRNVGKRFQRSNRGRFDEIDDRHASQLCRLSKWDRVGTIMNINL